MKRKIFTILLIVLISYSLNAQNSEKQENPSKIGISFSAFGPDDVRNNAELIGVSGKLSDKFFTIGVNYLKPLTTWLDFETGIEYSNYKFIIDPYSPSGIYQAPYGTNFSMISVPVNLRLNFLKYFFITSGLFLDFDTTDSYPIDNQNGIGAVIGIGAKYDFNFGGSVFIYPYSKYHALIPFSPVRYQERIYENGIRIGLMYNLNRKK